MKHHTYNDPENTAAYVAYRATCRAIIEISSFKNQHLRLIDINAALPTENYHFKKSVYMYEMECFDGFLTSQIYIQISKYHSCSS